MLGRIPQFAQIVDENELVILTRCEIEIGQNANGFIDIVYPYAAVKPYRELLKSRLRTGESDDEKIAPGFTIWSSLQVMQHWAKSS